MIKLNFEYTILFTSTVAGVGTAADSAPTAVLWRNGSASGVSVTVSTTAQTGLYKAVFTTGSGWSIDDFLELYVTATIAGTSGYLAKVWSSTEIGAAVLDSDARVKLASTQPDYAPLKSSDYTAPANSDIYAIRAKTDNLPSDPADQSLIIDATNAVMARLGFPVGASVSADIAAVKTDTGNLVTRITANLFSGITYLSRWLGALAGKTADTTTREEINATTAGAGYNETTDSQEAIRDRGDAAWITGAGGSGGGPAYSAAVVAARLPVGAAAGWPQEIICGSAYLTELGTHVPVYVKDVDDTILAAMGDKTFADVDFVAILRLSPLTDANKLLSRPAATIEIDSDDDPGIVFNDDTAGEEYFELQMPKAKTVLGEVRTRYLCQLILRWGDGSEYEWIVNLGESKFIRGVAAAT